MSMAESTPSTSAIAAFIWTSGSVPVALHVRMSSSAVWM